MTVRVQDTFTDTNGTSLTSHTPDTDVVGNGWAAHAVQSTETPSPGQIQGNALEFQANSDGAAIDAGISDAKCSVDWHTVAAQNNRGSMFVRASGTSDTIQVNFRVPNQDISIYERVSDGIVTLVNSEPYSWTAGNSYALRVEVDGTSIEFYVDDVLEASTTSSAQLTETKFGLRRDSSDTGMTFDDFLVETLTSIYEDSVSLAAEAAVTAAAAATVEGSGSLGVDAGLTVAAETTFEATASLGLDSGLQIAGGLSLDSAITLAGSMTTTAAPVVTVEATLTLGPTQDMSAAPSVTAEAAADLGMAASVTVAAAAVIEAATELAESFGLTSAGGFSYENSIALAVEQALSSTAGLEFSESLTLALQSDVDVAVSVTIEGAAALALESGITAASILTVEESITLNQSVVLAAVCQSVLEAGLTLDSVQAVTVSGAFSVTVTTPAGRKLTVSLANRTLYVPAENRTIH